jgi:hypothetical protein
MGPRTADRWAVRAAVTPERKRTRRKRHRLARSMQERNTFLGLAQRTMHTYNAHIPHILRRHPPACDGGPMPFYCTLGRAEAR